MKCDFYYCIYNDNFICLLDEIEIDAIGQCEECIIVSLPEGELEELKKEQSRRIT